MSGRKMAGLLVSVVVLVAASAAQDKEKNSPANAEMTGNVLLMRLNENPAQHGSGIADASGSGNNGTLYTHDGASNKSLNAALFFDGVDDYVDCGTGVGKPSKYTITAWIRPSAYESSGFVVSSTGGNSASWGLIGRKGAGVEVWVSDGRKYQYYRAGKWNATNYPVYQWTFITATVDGVRIRYYRNGTEIGSGLSQTVQNGGKVHRLSIGKLGEANGYHFEGAINDVAVYDRALTAEEIKKCYNSGAAKHKEKSSPAPGKKHDGKGPEVLKNILSPNGGEEWGVNSRHCIRWETSHFGPESSLMVGYSTDGGKNWTEIAPSPNNGKFVWHVPNTLSREGRIRMSDRTSGVRAESKSNFSIVPSQEVFNYKWIKVAMKPPLVDALDYKGTKGIIKMRFAPRDGAGALVYKGKMWLLGGWNPIDKKNFPKTCTNDVLSSEDGASWAVEKANTFGTEAFDPDRDWEGRHTAGYVVFKDKMWIIGGDPIQGHYQYDVWNSSDGKIWHHVNKGKDVPWGPRILYYTVSFKDKIWVMGGQTTPQYAPAEERFYNDIWNTSDGVNWTPVKPHKPYWPQRGMIGGSVVFKGRIWILGGGTYDTPKRPVRKFFNDVWSSSDGVNWKRHVEFAPWKPRQYHDVAVFDDKMWVMEGWNKGNRNDVWYSSDGVNWYELPETPWAPRHAASVFVHDNALWMVAGNNMRSDVWKLQRTPE